MENRTDKLEAGQVELREKKARPAGLLEGLRQARNRPTSKGTTVPPRNCCEAASFHVCNLVQDISGAAAPWLCCTAITLWLGHESVETTQVYLHADLRIKEKKKALEKTRPVGVAPGRFKPDNTLLGFLKSL